MTVIRAENLTKTFLVKRKAPGFWGSLQSLVKPDAVEKEAVRGISFRVEKGENGGLSGAQRGGQVDDDQDAHGDPASHLRPVGGARDGAAEGKGPPGLPHRDGLRPEVAALVSSSSRGHFALMADIYELPAKPFRERRDELVERFGLEPHLHTPVRKLSLGERMRCEMAVALLHRPEILFLDEPTIGMDVVVKQKIREMIRLFNRKEGVTVFLTSHDAGDVEELCDRAIIINHGEVVMDVPVHQLKRDVLKYKIVHLKLGAEPDDFTLPGTEVLKRKGTGLKLKVDILRTTVEAVIGRLLERYPILDINVEDPSMEDVITTVYEAKGG